MCKMSIWVHIPDAKLSGLKGYKKDKALSSDQEGGREGHRKMVHTCILVAGMMCGTPCQVDFIVAEGQFQLAVVSPGTEPCHMVCWAGLLHLYIQGCHCLLPLLAVIEFMH